MARNRLMDILMFGWEFPPFNSGGLGTACYGLTHALARKQIKVNFVLPKKHDLKSDAVDFVFADIPNVKIQTVDSVLHPYITPHEYSELLELYMPQIYGNNLFEEVIRYAAKASDIAKKTYHNVIHAHDWLSFGAGIAAKKISGKPLIAHVHATEFDRSGGNSVHQLVYDIERKGMEKADLIIAVSNLTKQIITKQYGIPAHKVRVVYNGIHTLHRTRHDEAEHIRRNLGKIVLFAGRLTLQKGPDWFIKVAKRVLEFDPHVTFVIAGSGDMQGQVMRMTADYGISDKVLFAGFLRDKELEKIYQAADVYMLPSVSEPFGITPLESLTHGTPVLVSKQSGVSEILTHALKSDFWDVDEMANKILAILEHHSLRQTLSENGKQEVQRYTWDKPAQQCISIYKELIH